MNLRRSLASTLLLAGALASGCGLFKSKDASGPPEPKAEDASTEEVEAKEAKAEAPDEPAPLTQAELEEQMAPPEGLLDLRPIVGTDPDDPIPAVFRGAKKGMTKKELGKLFPGVEQHTVDMLTLTSRDGGKTWYRVKGNQAHVDILNVEYDDEGGLEVLGYLIDEKKSSPELWEYMKKVAGLKWGKPELGVLDAKSTFASWTPKGVKEIQIQGGGSDMVSVTVKL